MHALFRTFKRHYHKTRKLIQLLHKNGSFELQIKAMDTNVYAKNTRYCQMLWIGHVRQQPSLMYPTDDPAQLSLNEF